MSESLIKLRVYKYSSTALNGCGEELDKVMVGGKITSCLDDTLDTAEISLNGVSESEPYKPLTKFVVALEQDNQDTQYFHYELRYDNVEKLSMSDNLYKHTLYLGNPAISCQKRTCDNFAISYRLKDVRLDKTVIDEGFSQKTNIVKNRKNVNQGRYLNTTYNFGSTDTTYQEHRIQTGKWLKWVHNSVENYKITDNALTDLENLNYLFFIDNGQLTEELCEKFKSNYSTTRSKFQIFNYDSSNKYYGEGKTYNTYFESVPTTLNSSTHTTKKFHYVVPQLCAYTSKTNDTMIDQVDTNTLINIPSSNEKVDSGYSNLVLMPTKTTIKIINLTTKEEQQVTYSSSPSNLYGQVNSLDNPKILWSFANNGKQGLGVATENPITDLKSNIIVGYDFIQAKSGNIKTLAPIFMEISNTPTNQTIDINILPGYKYEITTKADFGDTWNRYTYRRVDSETFEKVKYTGSTLGVGELMNSMYFYGWNVDGSNELLTEKVNANDYEYSFNFCVYNITDQAPLAVLKSQSSIPNCYDLFKKAQISSKAINYSSSKTYEENIKDSCPYIVSEETRLKLESQNIIEDKYYNKNLWEMFMQIGKYIHAKPYIRFYQDKYELKFKNYGISEKSTKKATTNSLFSNNNIENYISSLDSYLENYFEYGNEVEEYLKPTDNDGSSVCTNDNAVLKTKYPIMEITGFYVALKTDFTWKDITDYIYEYNIYKLLSALGKADVTSATTYYHFKGNSVYYHLNGTQIQGLQNVEPSANNDNPYAIKRIIGEVMGTDSDKISSIQVNDYIFKITYRTKDDVRFKTFKPDLRKFMLNASNDNYPMQSQFSNQSDKVVDSNKYGNNAYGTLLRSGNDTLDYQEYITDISQLKDSGELYDLGNQYYVAKNTMVVYPTYVECEVEYSKDYNKLSEIIGIDSAPRFYEIAEDGSIKRNICVDKFYQVGTQAETDSSNYITIQEYRVLDKICLDIKGNYDYKYCLVHFSGANKQYNTDTNSFSSYVIVPCVEYATGNTLTLECDMEDNFGAGENQKDISSEYANMYYNSSWLIPILKSLGVVAKDKLYSGTLTQRQSVQYCDVYGKADLLSFAFLKDIISDNKTSYSTNLPNGDKDVLTIKNKDSSYVNKYPLGLITNNNGSVSEKSIVLEKDCRETIGINYNTHILTESDRFVLSNTLFKKKSLAYGSSNIYWYIYYFDTEINKMERKALESLGAPIYSYYKGISPIAYSSVEKQVSVSLKDVGVNIDEILEKTKCIALGYYDGGIRYFVIARNVNGLTNSEKIATWYFTKPKFE